MRALRVNETKITSGNVFIVNLFALGNEKNQKITKGPSFGTVGGVLTTVLAIAPVYAFFWTILVLAIFWPLLVAFRTSD